MENFIKNLKRKSIIEKPIKEGESFKIILPKVRQNKYTVGALYEFKVKDYLTKDPTSIFPFHNDFNNGIACRRLFRAIVAEEDDYLVKVKSTEWEGWLIKSAVINADLLDEKYGTV